ncbi:hypothetical protein JCM10908_002264 [Rhodotorula pacifica]|uniref:uncharacterized protein n=1 Tax=Rhodotorula pacifica TaxID=1495444 RepID=UPI00317C1A60
MATIDKPIRTYFEPRARAQAGIGLAKLPTEVKQLIARMCDEQDQAMRNAVTDLQRRQSGDEMPDELTPQHLRANLSSVGVLYSLSREWQQIATPIRFKHLQLRRIVDALFRARIMPCYAVHIKTLDLDGLTDSLMESLLLCLPHLQNVVHLRVGHFLHNTEDRRREVVFRHFEPRLKRIDSCFLDTFSQAQTLLSGAERLVDLELHADLTRDQPQALWDLLESLPGLKRLDYTYYRPSNASNSLSSFRDCFPSKPYRLPAIQHLAIRASDDNAIRVLDGLQPFVAIFAQNLLGLVLGLDVYSFHLSNVQPRDDWTLPKGGLLPELRTLNMPTSLHITAHILGKWQDPEAATKLRRITLTHDDYAQPESDLPPLALPSLLSRCPHLELISIDWPYMDIKEATRYYAGSSKRIQVTPRLYPLMVMTAVHAADKRYDFMRAPSLPPSASSAQPPLELEPELRGCEQIVEGIDETLEFLAQWRDRAILQADPVALVKLAEVLKHADVARVRHLA